MIIAAPRLFGAGFDGPGAVVVKGKSIFAVLDHVPAYADVVLAEGSLAPGLIDLHNNGAFGVDCATATPGQFQILCRNLVERGVTSFAPTIITAPIEDVLAAAGRVQAAMMALAGEPVSQMLGVHLEGPFLSPLRLGAHRADWLLPPDEPSLDRLLGDPRLAATLRLITLAPELPGALAAIRRLVRCGIVVALGHTDADASIARLAIKAGATLATHVFTAMRPFHHRDPGLIGVALADPAIMPCFIADAVHAAPIALKLGFEAAGSRAIAVTDSVLLAGLAAGTWREFGGASAINREGAARRVDGTLAGAIVTLDEGIRRLIRAGVAPAAAIEAATAAPARALGLADRGRLEAGRRADLVWFDAHYEVRNAWIGGVAVRPVARRDPTPEVRLPLTETVRRDLDDLDLRPSRTIIDLLLAQEVRAQAALQTQSGTLAALADAVAAKLEAGGRLFYAGAGTAGRLAVLDAVECGPTFSVPPGVIVPLIAGGADAIAGAVEGAEDDAEAAIALLAGHRIGPGDALIGIAASGATPFTLAALQAAGAAGALTGCIANSPGPIADCAQFSIVIASGAEILAGSTRLSAGTTQKIALNALSTTIMIRLGKTFGPHMVDLKPTNAKLRLRATRIVAAIGGCDAERAGAALKACGFEVKTATVMICRDIDAMAARRALAANGQRLRAALTNCC